MKTSSKILYALLAILPLSLLLVSCGGGSDDPYTEESTFVTSIDTLTLAGLKSQTGGSTSYSVTFSDHLASTIFSNLIKSKTTFQNSGFGIGVFGLTALNDTAKISNLTVTIGSTDYSLGTCYASGSGDLSPDTYESGDTYLSLVKAYFSAILSGSSYKTTVKVSFTTNVDIVSSNNVTLRIKYYGKYYYKNYN